MKSLNACKKSHSILKFPKLDKISLCIQIFSKTRFAINTDLSSELKYFIFLRNKDKSCQSLFWTSYIVKILNRSVLGSTIMAFTDAFYMVYVMKEHLRVMKTSSIPLSMIKDNLSLFDNQTRAISTLEKRLKIDLESVQSSYERERVQDVVYIWSEYNIADSSTRVKKESILVDAIEQATLDRPIHKWVFSTEESTAVLKNGEC